MIHFLILDLNVSREDTSLISLGSIFQMFGPRNFIVLVPNVTVFTFGRMNSECALLL